MPAKKCIMLLCTTTAACAPLHYLVAQQLAAAAALGYNGSTTADVFIAGHSLGGVCAGTLAAAYYQNTTEVASGDDNYAAVVVMGSYVDGSDVAAYPLPVLTLGAELDGGAGRPGVISESLRSRRRTAGRPRAARRGSTATGSSRRRRSRSCPGSTTRPSARALRCPATSSPPRLVGSNNDVVEGSQTHITRNIGHHPRLPRRGWWDRVTTW
jgi:hypothetical protein